MLSLSVAIAVPFKQADVEVEEITDLKSTTMQTAFITKSGNLWLIDHKNGFVPVDMTIRDSNLRHITQLESSFGHFLALKTKVRASIEEWDTPTLQKWVSKIGFDYIARVILYGRVTGKMLASCDYDYMRDTLGIADENLCSKLKGCIDEVRTSAIEDSCLYGWGNNKHGQLACK